MSQPDTAEAMRLHLLGERDSARAAFEKLLAPRQSLIANYYLAQLKLKQNRYAEASFRKTLELNPNDTRALGTVEMLTEVPEP